MLLPCCFKGGPFDGKMEDGFTHAPEFIVAAADN